MERKGKKGVYERKEAEKGRQREDSKVEYGIENEHTVYCITKLFLVQ